MNTRGLKLEPSDIIVAVDSEGMWKHVMHALMEEDHAEAGRILADCVQRYCDERAIRANRLALVPDMED